MTASPASIEPVLRCPLCGSAARAPLFAELRDALFRAPGAWTLVRCADCAAAYLDPRLTRASIGLAYERYYTHGGAGPQPGSPAPARSGIRARLRNGYLRGRYGYQVAPAWMLARWVVPALFPLHAAAFDTSVRNLRLPHCGARLLDVGCGAGEFLDSARSLGWSAEGLEIDPRAAAVARARGFQVIESTIEEAALPEASYDAVTLNHVLEHLHDPLCALVEVRRLLRPGGALWIATPNLDSPLRRTLGEGWRGLEPPRHLVLFSRAALAAALRRAGFVRLRWPRAFPLTRWMLEASPVAPEVRARVARRAVTLRLLELASLVSQRWSEQLVALAEKPAGEGA